MNFTTFKKMPLMGILRGYSIEDTLQILACYSKAGLTTIEITMNTANADSIITACSQQYKSELNIGAGTVRTIEEAKKAITAGAQFIVSPITDATIIRYCRDKNIPVFPGGFTPTEVFTAWELGATMVKVFPAQFLGPKYIKELLAPLDQVKLMPTGGVNQENIADYIKAGAKAFGVGSMLFDKKLIQSKDWGALEQKMRTTRMFVEQILNGGC